MSPDSFVGGVLVEVHPDRVTHKREIYNFLDLLGDIGGLSEALKSFGALFMILFG